MKGDTMSALLNDSLYNMATKKQKVEGLLNIL